MAAFQAPNFTFSPLTSSSKSRIHIIKSALQFPDLTRLSSSTSHNLPKSRFNQFISTKRLNKNKNDVISESDVKHLQTRIQSRVGSGRVTESDVADAMERVLTIDRAYPLPLLGAMLDKFPEKYEPARWWPPAAPRQQRSWSEGMKEIVKVVKNKDLEDYERLGSKALKISKALAVAGPVMTGMAAAAAGFNMPVVAGVCGALATVANTVEHGGQVGMVLEMYRNCAGFFKQLEDDVAEGDVESEEVFELKMTLRLGRSVTELRDLAAESKRRRGSVDEFACKLF